ncbi:Uncharacterised protein [Acetobacterium wieringae]|nr:Uncharacterised protein [Acetobacterium wieringae]
MKAFFLRIKQNKKTKCVFKFMLAEALTIAFSIIEAIILVIGVLSYGNHNLIGFIEHLIYFALVTSIHSFQMLNILEAIDEF